MRSRSSSVVVVLAWLSLVACGVACGDQGGAREKKPAEAGDPIAVVGDETVTVEQVQKKLDEQSPFVRARYADLEKRKELLDAQVRFEVLAAEARARGYDKDPEVDEAVKKIIVQKLTREEFDGRVQIKDITDAELQRYFDEHKAEYQKPEMVRASVITIAASVDGAKAKAEEAQRLAADPKKRDDRAFFKELVTKYSTDESTKGAGGDIRYLSQDEVASRYGKDAAAWLFADDETNAVSPVFSSSTAAGQAFHVFKRTGRRKAIERSFDQVKNQIRNVVYREKRTAAFNKFVDELKGKHGVKTWPEKLEKLKIPALPKDAPMELGGDDGHGHGAPPTLATPAAGPFDPHAAHAENSDASAAGDAASGDQAP